MSVSECVSVYQPAHSCRAPLPKQDGQSRALPRWVEVQDGADGLPVYSREFFDVAEDDEALAYKGVVEMLVETSGEILHVASWQQKNTV